MTFYRLLWVTDARRTTGPLTTKDKAESRNWKAEILTEGNPGGNFCFYFFVSLTWLRSDSHELTLVLRKSPGRCLKPLLSSPDN
jgi:hypothetical protein